MPEKQKKILLVDDDRLIVTIVCRALTMKGFHCYSAGSVKAALEILKHETPDIILSDYSMPGTDGFAFRKMVLDDMRWRNIPFVFFTSFADEDLMQQGLDLQAVDYIDKNTPVQLVVSKLNNILDTIRKEHEKSIHEIGVAARALNLRSVPEAALVIHGFTLDFLHQPYQNYPGGDFIDFIEADERYTFAVLGDVMGKKWGAWFFSFNFLSYIRSAVRLCVLDGDLSTASILNKINKVVNRDPVLNDVLSTLSLLMVRHQTGEICYSGAGDLPVIVYRHLQQQYEKIRSPGLLIGVLPDGRYEETVIKMQPGDQIVAVSDGMTDYQDETGKKIDFNRFLKKLVPSLGKENTLELIKEELFSDDKNAGIIDDRSLLLITRSGKMFNKN